MGQVRDIMGKNVITIEKDQTVHQAANLMKENDISFLVIVENGDPVGVLTERDFVQKFCTNNKKSVEMKISEIMSYKFRSVEPTTEIEGAIQKMLNNNIRRLLVLDNKKLVGVITQTDLASHLRDKLLVDGTIKNIQKK
jgi:CBS domain-containing protein